MNDLPAAPTETPPSLPTAAPPAPGWGTRLRNNSFIRLIVALFLMILMSIAFSAVVMALLGRGFSDTRPGLRLLVDVLSACVAFGTYYAYVHGFERRPVTELSRPGAVRELLAGVMLGTLLLGATIAMMALLGYYSIVGSNAPLAVLPILGISLTAAVSEEIIMRAIFLRLVERALGTWIALLFSALLFGLMHHGNDNATWWSSSAIAIEAGILLGAAYVYTRRLWLVIGLHFAWNFAQGGIFGVAVSGMKFDGWLKSHTAGPELLTGGAFGAEASIFALIFCLGTGIVFAVLAHKQGKFIRPFWQRRRTLAVDPPAQDFAATPLPAPPPTQPS